MINEEFSTSSFISSLNMIQELIIIFFSSIFINFVETMKVKFVFLSLREMIRLYDYSAIMRELFVLWTYLNCMFNALGENDNENISNIREWERKERPSFFYHDTTNYLYQFKIQNVKKVEQYLSSFVIPTSETDMLGQIWVLSANDRNFCLHVMFKNSRVFQPIKSWFLWFHLKL